VSELFPEGVENIRDLPYRLFEAVRMATIFIGFDELPKEERPPRRIWLNSEALHQWFEQVERDREKKYGGKSGGDTVLEGEPVENKAARSLISG
jgi:hypothetical protein